MDLKSKLYQMFILGTGKNLVEAIKNGLGGVIFFTKDIHNEKQFTQLITNLGLYSSTPLYFSIDQEGGRVERTENINNGKKYFSAKFAYAQGVLAQQTRAMLEDLKRYGINLNFAPCLDVNTNPDNPIIGERAYSDNPQDVIKAYDIIAPIYQEMGIVHCIKHFPGHGDAAIDSHIELPTIDLSLSEMENSHLKPFKHALNAPMMMIAHLKFNFWGELPTSLNENAIDYLKKTLGFKGIIITDDMMMGAVQKIPNAYEAAIMAGVDMFIFRNSDDDIIEIIENLARKAQTDEDLQNKIEAAYKKIVHVKMGECLQE